MLQQPPRLPLLVRDSSEQIGAEAPACRDAGIDGHTVMSVAGHATISTQRGCKLRIARYPTFTYNPTTGGGSGQLVGPPTDGRQHVRFDTAVLNIPTVSWRNTRIAGFAPILGASIAIKPTKLEGYVEQQTGRVQLTFCCQFNLSVFGFYKVTPGQLSECTWLVHSSSPCQQALQVPPVCSPSQSEEMPPKYHMLHAPVQAPPLQVVTELTTESINGRYTQTNGKRMNTDGLCELVGTTNVPKTSDNLLNRFLTLPTEAFALMRATINLQADPANPTASASAHTA